MDSGQLLDYFDQIIHLRFSLHSAAVINLRMRQTNKPLAKRTRNDQYYAALDNVKTDSDIS